MSESSATSYEPNKSPQGNRRFRIPSNPWLPYIGDCRALEKYLASKEGIGWIFPKYVNALLRGISQVIFANNPLSGLVILIALFWADVFVGLAAVVSATSAIITAVLMRQDPSSNAAGLTTYNAVLVGTVTSSLWTPLYGEALGIKLWSFIILGSALSVFVTSALANMLSSFKISLPALTLPFNVVVVVLFICLMPIRKNANIVNENDPVALRLEQNLGQDNLGLWEASNGLDNVLKTYPVLTRQVRKAEDLSDTPTTDIKDEETDVASEEVVDWGKMLTGIILSSGQVYGVQDVITSVLIYVAVMIYSPILLMMSVVGAILGTIFGTLFAQAPYEALYTGIWGYNALLSASSVGGFFIVLTCHSFWNAFANVVFTVILQQTLIIALKPASVPVFTIPFVLSTLIFLSVTTSGNQLPRVASITYPEMQRYIYRETNRVKGVGKLDKESAIAGDVAEEKELVLTDVKVIREDEEENEEETTIAQVESKESKDNEESES